MALRQQTLLPFSSQSNPPNLPAIATLSAPSESTLSVYSGLDDVQADHADADNTFEREDLSPKRKTKERGRTSFIYNFMHGGVDKEHKFFNEKGKLEGRCKFCNQNYIISGGTKLPTPYLNWHKVYVDSLKDIKAKHIQESIKHAMEEAESNPLKRRRFNDSESSGLKLDRDQRHGRAGRRLGSWRS